MFILLTGEHPFDPTGNASGGEMRIAICRGTEYVKGRDGEGGGGGGGRDARRSGREGRGKEDRHRTRGEGGSMGGGEEGPAAGVDSASSIVSPSRAWSSLSPDAKSLLEQLLARDPKVGPFFPSRNSNTYVYSALLYSPLL